MQDADRRIFLKLSQSIAHSGTDPMNIGKISLNHGAKRIQQPAAGHVLVAENERLRAELDAAKLREGPSGGYGAAAALNSEVERLKAENARLRAGDDPGQAKHMISLGKRSLSWSLPLCANLLMQCFTV
jgi:hypothetical protein